ncbi:MAG TPA: cytochrome P450, partial [Acidimicrobiia bacterium]|nr:cytochrome P450 [Acidimicrobiia bacterium]
MSTTTNELPADPTVPGFYLRPDYYDLLADLRRDAPVHEFAPGLRTIARYEDIREISRDPARFCSSMGALVNDPARTWEKPMKAPSILHMDPPDHVGFRKLVNREFTPRAIAKLEPRIRELARTTLDRTPDEGLFDFVDLVAAPFPLLVIAELLGIPDGDRREFREWSDAMIEATDKSQADVAAGTGELFRYLMEHIEAKRADPGGDVVSLLVDAEVDGRSLDPDELLIFLLALLVAGNETTRTLISGGTLTLFEHPDQRADLATDAALVPGAVEECLRWVTPIQAFARTVTADTVIGGVEVNERDYLIMLYASGNRDEAAFGPTANVFDIRRDVNPPHLAFGFGEHLCLGAALARMEARILFEEMLARHPEYVVAGEPEWVASSLVR